MSRFSFIGFTALLSLTLFSCTKKSQVEYGLDVKETLRVNIMSEPPSLDWNKSTDTTSALIQENLMEGLVTYDYRDPELTAKPGLATAWTSTPDAKTWTFTLRTDVKWSDGQPFTPQHVVDSWERLLNPATASEYSYFLYSIKNAKAYNEGKITDFSQVGVKLNEQGQVVVELDGSISYFPYLLTHHSTYPVRKEIIAQHGPKWTEPGNIVTLGPYTLKVWDHDKAMVLERNENYYGEKALTKNILCYMINESSTALNLFDAGKVDVLTDLPSTELVQLKKRPEYREVGLLTLYFFGFNVTKPPVDKAIVRQAIAHAIDRQEVTTMLGGGQIPLTSWVPAGMFGYEPGRGASFDIEKAKALLDQAGYQDRSTLPKITLGFNTNENHQRIAENIQAQLKRNLGIDIELKNEEWKVYLTTLRANAFPMFRMGWVADYPDPDNFMNLMTSYSENNRGRWKNKEYDQLVEKAARELNKEERKALYSKAQILLTEQEVPAVPIYSGVAHLLVNKRVDQFPVNALNRMPFKKVTLK